MMTKIAILFVTLLLLSQMSFAQTIKRASSLSIQNLRPIDIQFPPLQLSSWCQLGNGKTCNWGEVNLNIAVLPAGYSVDDYQLFVADYKRLVSLLSSIDAPVFTSQYKQRIAYHGRWIPGGEVGSTSANFRAEITSVENLGKFLTLNQSMLSKKIGEFSFYNLRNPYNLDAVVVIYKTAVEDVRPLSTPAQFTKRNYGIMRISSQQLSNGYIVSHEIGHAALNFLDEYSETGLGTDNITDLVIDPGLTRYDSIISLLIGKYPKFYEMYPLNFAEILADNGTRNTQTQILPLDVPFSAEGAALFEQGVYHSPDPSIMGRDESFSLEHNQAQTDVIEQTFGFSSKKSNNRVKAIGPIDIWSKTSDGKIIPFMFYDANKNAHLNPTTAYEIQFIHEVRIWETCWASEIFPYPCYRTEWQSYIKQFYKENNWLELDGSTLASMNLDNRLCLIGAPDTYGNDVCKDLGNTPNNLNGFAFDYRVRLQLPYQTVNISSLKVAQYYWHIRTISAGGFSTWSKYTPIQIKL